MPRKIFKEEHHIFRESFKKFLEREVVPFIEKLEHEGIMPKSVWKKMGENGFLCVQLHTNSPLS
jgi:acyl-CoA dehydrogenase